MASVTSTPRTSAPSWSNRRASRAAIQLPGSMPAIHAAPTRPYVVAEPRSVSRMKKTSITLMPPIAAITTAVLATMTSISGSWRSRQPIPVPLRVGLVRGASPALRRPRRCGPPAAPRVRSSRPATTSAR